MKKIILAIAFALIAIGANAQEQGKIRLGVEAGYTIPKGGGGLMVGTELKYNIEDNWNIGLRWESAAMAKAVDGENADISANSGYLITTDFYLHGANSSSNFAPFVGAGAGVYGVGGLKLNNNYSGGSVSTKAGCLLRAGFEVGKFRTTVSYNIIPSSKYNINYKDGSGTVIDTKDISVSNKYLSISIGFYIGGGKWNR